MTVEAQAFYTTEIFIRDAYAQDDDKKAGIKAGDKLHLSVTWREAMLQKDGSYKISAYNQVVGETKPEDITETAIPESQRLLPDSDAVTDSFNIFNAAYLGCENDTYTGPMYEDAPLTEETIERHRKTAPQCAA